MKAILFLLVTGGTAAAQAPGVTDVEVPSVIIDQGDQTAGVSADEELDLANIVQSAAKGVTTVQEAPAIVTVITADEIRDRQFLDIDTLVDTVPGWGVVGLTHSTFVSPTVRGQIQAVQFLHDGLSLFDPFVNIPTATRVQPIELVKRVEMITGPGGVLWGSNSLLGILNLITKDAEDVDGVEMGATAGTGDGDRNMLHAYAMVGKTDLLGGKLKVFAHGSIETYQGSIFQMPVLIFHNPPPQPNSPNIYGPLESTDQPQSFISNFNAKVAYDKLQLRVSVPIGEKYNPLGLSGEPVRKNLPDDGRCPMTAPGATPDPTCADPLHTTRSNRSDNFDRYATLEYRTRFAQDQAGITVRTYFEQFVRNFEPLQVLSGSPLVPGGLAFAVDFTSYRAGGAFDGDIELGPKVRVQYGGEAFNEWKPNNTTQSIQGQGTQSEITAPYDLTRLPVPCPQEYNQTLGRIAPIPNCPLTFAFPADRTVFGAYVNPQWRPSKELIFDIGGRLQVAPGSLGSLSYPLTSTVAATMVWNFIPNWHLKLNYAQGFRPPVFNDTSSNGAGLQLAGNPNLKVETSDASQIELNARVYKGDRRIRELSFRIDGSYTRLHDLIVISSGNYDNSGERGIASVEFLGKLYVQGGHRIELGYTWMQVDSSDKGLFRSLPENWFNLATVFSLIPGKLTATTNLKVTGAIEDANRLVEYRGSFYDAAGVIQNQVTVNSTDLVMDLLPPMAELSLGMAWAVTPKLLVRANVYDALVEHTYQPDILFDYEPHFEYLPNPNPGFRAYLSALYQY